MKPDLLKKTLVKFALARKPVLVKGAPGVGKSDTITAVANDIGHDLVLSHPAVADPTDAKGLGFPSADKKSAVFLPYGEMATLLTATRPTLWFIDDLGQANPAVQAAYMQWLLARQVGEHRLPDCVTIMAATNRRKDKAGVGGMLEPVKGRFVTILELEACVDAWTRWALSHNMPTVLVAFIRSRGVDMLLAHQATSEIENSPTPRNWSHVGDAMNCEVDKEAEAEVFGGAVGTAAANEFIQFLELCRQMQNPDAVLLNPDAAAIPPELNILWALCTRLVELVNVNNFGRFARYAERLVDADKGEFAALMMKGALDECPDVQSTPAFTMVAATDLGKVLFD